MSTVSEHPQHRVCGRVQFATPRSFGVDMAAQREVLLHGGDGGSQRACEFDTKASQAIEHNTPGVHITYAEFGCNCRWGQLVEISHANSLALTLRQAGDGDANESDKSGICCVVSG